MVEGDPKPEHVCDKARLLQVRGSNIDTEMERREHLPFLHVLDDEFEQVSCQRNDRPVFFCRTDKNGG